MLCLRAECPLWRSFDKTIQAHGVITLDAKTDKEAQMINRARYTRHMTPQSPVTSSHIATALANASAPQVSPPLNLLNIAQRENMHENQFVRLAKAIPSMIQSALKKALQPAKDMLTHLCSKVDVLENLEAVPPQGEAPRSPPDDWWLGYHNNANFMSDEEELHHSPPPPFQMHSVYDVDPSWALGGVATTSYHELRTLPGRWIAPGPGLPITLPPDPMQPTTEDIASWVFDVFTYTWKPRPNR
ncbi:hypothetical protein HAX54_048307 [Datura stramonium]|uniref:Uncharacterized protein n=1 Tax=Datura stramonium TaxID=4076 RepID=A0ABS8SU85_DATST|nr:hypothetical protein [Datura stramonium]